MSDMMGIREVSPAELEGVHGGIWPGPFGNQSCTSVSGDITAQIGAILRFLGF